MTADLAYAHLPSSLAGATSSPVRVRTGVSVITFGIASDMGDAVVRVELAIADEGGDLVWFDTGTGMDIDAGRKSVAVSVTGYAAARVAVRTPSAAGTMVVHRGEQL